MRSGSKDGVPNMRRRKNQGMEIIPLIRRRERPREATLFDLRLSSYKPAEFG
jgi:hypothetical protein